MSRLLGVRPARRAQFCVFNYAFKGVTETGGIAGVV